MLSLIIMKGKVEENDNSIDIVKNSSIPNLLLNLLKNLVRSDLVH